MVRQGRLFILLVVLSVLGDGRTAAADDTCVGTGTCNSGGGGGAQGATVAARAQAAGLL